MTDVVNQIGQLFIIGFPGEVPSGEVLGFLAEKNIGGVILVEENCSSTQIVKDTIKRIKSVYDGSTPFIAIDQEGGRVSRLRGMPTKLKAPAEYVLENNIEGFQEAYSRSVVFMESLGINMNLFPVCDIDIANNPCLTNRCFGSTPETVAPFVETAVKTAKANGLFSCLKHFPGLGASDIDPHNQVATADYDELVWKQRECVPFTAGLAGGAELVMTTHLQLPKIDETIATGSRKIIALLLRNYLGFDGPVITDDLTMKGATSLGSIGERAVAALNAGHDLLLFGRDFDQSQEAYSYVCDAITAGKVNMDYLEAAISRVNGIKFKLDSTVPS